MVAEWRSHRGGCEGRRTTAGRSLGPPRMDPKKEEMGDVYHQLVYIYIYGKIHHFQWVNPLFNYHWVSEAVNAEHSSKSGDLTWFDMIRHDLIQPWGNFSIVKNGHDWGDFRRDEDQRCCFGAFFWDAKLGGTLRFRKGEKDIVLWLGVTTWNAGNRFYCLHFSTWDIQTLVDLATGNWDDYPSGSRPALEAQCWGSTGGRSLCPWQIPKPSGGKVRQTPLLRPPGWLWGGLGDCRHP